MCTVAHDVPTGRFTVKNQPSNPQNKEYSLLMIISVFKVCPWRQNSAHRGHEKFRISRVRRLGPAELPAPVREVM